MPLSEQIRLFLREIVVLPRRMLLETPGVQATVPMLRGVWGAALHDLDSDVYAAVFSPVEDRPGGRTADEGFANGCVAGYVLRPATPDPEFAPAIEWILIGDAVGREHLLRRAWDVASGMGLGPERRRFYLRQWIVLGPDGLAQERGSPWLLSDATWHLPEQSVSSAAGLWCRRPACVSATITPQTVQRAELPAGATETAAPQLAARQAAGTAAPQADARTDPCRLCFPAPLRLRRHGQLIEQPTLSDLIVAACRRVRAFLPGDTRAGWDSLSREALELSRTVPAGAWQGSRLDLHRYSGRQKEELDLHGVSGSLELPEGPGELWPLLAAAQWLHLGKGTVMGLGQLCVDRLEAPEKSGRDYARSSAS